MIEIKQTLKPVVNKVTISAVEVEQKLNVSVNKVGLATNALVCQPAEFTLKNSATTVIETGLIASGASQTITAPNSTVVLKNTETTTLSTTAIPSSVTQNVLAPDGQCEVSNSAGLLATVAVPSGTTKGSLVGDSVVRVVDSAAAVISTNNIAATVAADLVAPDSVATLKDTAGVVLSTTNLKSNEAKNIQAPDASYNVRYTPSLTPIQSGSVVSGGSVTVDVPDPSAAGTTAMVLKTGQTNSSRIGDDGDIRAGRDRTTLGEPNKFGNTFRFTGVTGGYHDGNWRDVDGNIVTEAVAFPNAIAVDWASLDQASGDVLFWKYTDNGANATWNDCIDGALALNLGGYSDWYLPNIAQFFSLFNMGIQYAMNYAPFFRTQFGGTWDFLWTSTENPNNTANAVYLELSWGLGAFIFQGGKGLNCKWMAVRTGNISEL